MSIMGTTMELGTHMHMIGIGPVAIRVNPADPSSLEIFRRPRPKERVLAPAPLPQWLRFSW